MVLLATVQGAMTQDFGPSHLGVEPSMWSTGDKAYWLPYAGAAYFDDFHPGIDRSAPTGTPVRAMEAGTVMFAQWKDNISGFQVEVAINETTRFSVNHLSKILCRVGQKLEKGQTLGLVGSTGASTGPHTHEGVSIREQDAQGVYRTFLYDPRLFMVGGKFANDPRIQPEERFVVLNGHGINIRLAPPSFDARTDIFAYSRSKPKSGIYRRATGVRLSPITYQFRFMYYRETEIGLFAIVTGYGRRLAIHKTLCHFV